MFTKKLLLLHPLEEIPLQINHRRYEVSTVGHLKAELLSIWMKRIESLENGESEQSYDTIAENLIKRITAQEPGFSSSEFYKSNFEEYNPNMENNGH